MERMDREQFFAMVGRLSQDELQKALWTLYWRGTAAMRDRVAAAITPQAAVVKPRSAHTVNPQEVLAEVRQFVELARAGAYLAGDRRVRPKERTQWRFTFKRLMAQVREAMRGPDIAAGATAMETLIDLANEMRGYQYFHSEDAIEASGVVVSDEVSVLWLRLLEHEGLVAFCATAMPQLIRWESRYGWTTHGYGKVAEKEVPLATVLARILPVPDAWTVAADSYLDALDRCTPAPAAEKGLPWSSRRYEIRQRTESLAVWHELLFDQLAASDGQDRLDRLVVHPALDGPELAYLRARLAHHRDDPGRARELIQQCLTELPGHRGFLDFAAQIGAPLPAEAIRAASLR